MPHILLTGAGFTHNWGGWLAHEVFDYLLGSPKLTPELGEELWQSRNNRRGFEDTLQRLREHDTALSEQVRKVLEEILLDMFSDMESAFKSVPLEFTQRTQMVGQRPHVRDLLCQFDAIYTLNQDTLLENKYEKPGARWRGVHRPGLKSAGERLFQPASLPYTIPLGHQPYFKLHGSSDWRFNDSALLIMGGSKGKDIEEVPLLAAYRDAFRATACRPDTKIMVIGYGFADEHINDIVIGACAAGARLFIVDPRGVDVADCLSTALRNTIIGSSLRPLSTTLLNDSVERLKLMNFFTRP